MRFKNKMWLLCIGMLVVAGCASQPSRVDPIAENADPNAEIQLTEERMSQLHSKNLDIYAPKSYQKAADALKSAKEGRADNASNAKVLDRVAVARGWLNEVETRGPVSQKVLARASEAREYAIKAKANNTESKQFTALEKDFRELALEAEAGKMSSANKEADELARQYGDLETKAVLQTNLGYANINLTEAKDEGAPEYAPKSYQKALQSYDEAKIVVKSNIRTPAVYQDKVTQANKDANVALWVTRGSKKAGGKEAEDVVLQSLNQRMLIREMSEEQIAAENAAERERLRLLAVQSSERKDHLATEANTQAKLNIAREHQIAKERAATIQSKFGSNEAEVFEQGDKVIIRLKGLNFASNKSEIPTSSFALLQKVKDSISEFGTASVVIEGHTDSVGTPQKNQVLSEKRAKAVQDYLVANKSVDQDKIKAIGYGFEKPIAPNKTANQRALNRRIDVVIEPSSM